MVRDLGGLGWRRNTGHDGGESGRGAGCRDHEGNSSGVRLDACCPPGSCTDVTNIALCICVMHACCMASAVCLRVNFKDLDKDGIPDELDNDSDNDGIDDSMQTVLKLDVDPSEMDNEDLDSTENAFESYLGLPGDELEIDILSVESSNRRRMGAVYVEV